MKLKICGMKYEENISQVAELSPDYLGFIFYKKSARNFDTMIPKVLSSIKKTGVFVDEDIETVIRYIRRYKLQAIQLHGKESPEYCEKLQSQNVEIIKVFSNSPMSLRNLMTRP